MSPTTYYYCIAQHHSFIVLDDNGALHTATILRDIYGIQTTVNQQPNDAWAQMGMEWAWKMGMEDIAPLQ